MASHDEGNIQKHSVVQVLDATYTPFLLLRNSELLLFVIIKTQLLCSFLFVTVVTQQC